MDVAIKPAQQSWAAEARCGALSSTQLPATLKAGVAGVGWEENQEKKREVLCLAPNLLLV